MTSVAICPATGWWAVYYDHDSPTRDAWDAVRVLWWESDDNGRYGIVADGSGICNTIDLADDYGGFVEYVYDPSAYEEHGSVTTGDPVVPLQVERLRDRWETERRKREKVNA